MKRPFVVPAVTILMLAGASVVITLDASETSKRRPSVTAVDLGMMDGRFTIPAAINDRGAIVGQAFSSAAGQTVVFLWTSGRGFQEIVGRPFAQPFDINDRGQVVGSITPPDPDPPTGFLWSATDGFTDLGSFMPAAINNRGQIVGSCTGSDFSTQTACLWQDGVVTAVAPFRSAGSAINERGHLVGQGLFDNEFKAFLWTMRNGLAVLPGPDTTFPAAINRHDEIVGSAVGPGVIWPDPDHFILTPVGTVLVGVNDRREIVGRRGGDPWEAFVITRDGRTVSLGTGLPVGINKRSQVAGSRDAADGIHLMLWTLDERGGKNDRDGNDRDGNSPDDHDRDGQGRDGKDREP